MTDKATSSPVAVVTSEDKPETSVTATKKASSAAKSSKPRAKPPHPKTADMVTAAIVALQERGGSSLQAIKKYMANTYKIDTEKQATFIKKYLKMAVASGILIQTKGKGAAGSFKLAKVEAVKPKGKPATPAKAPKKVAVAKKPAAVKKPVTAKKAPTKKAAASPVSPKKAASKAPAAKPPKPKTTKTKPASKSPTKKSKPTTAKKAKPVVGRPKKVAPKKTVAAKK